jgi:hypothetical protein
MIIVMQGCEQLVNFSYLIWELMLLQIFINFYTVTAVEVFITTCFIKLNLLPSSTIMSSLNISKFLY